MRSASTVGSWIPIVINTIKSYSVDPEPLLYKAGITESMQLDINARIPYDTTQALLDLAVKATGDYSFGLTMRKHMEINAFQTLGLAVSMSNSLIDALQRIERYYQVISTTLSIELIECQDSYHLVYSSPSTMVERSNVTYDYCLSTIVQICQMRTNGQFKPRQAYITHVPPDHLIPRYKRIICQDLHVGADENYLVLGRDELEKELFPVQSNMLKIAEETLKDELESINELPLTQVIENHIRKILCSGAPTPEQAASYVNMSYRTLQRRLAVESTSYREILDNTRKNMATQLIESKKVPLIEVAFLLGFSDASSFSRSFKRWTGVTPARYLPD